MTEEKFFLRERNGEIMNQTLCGMLYGWGKRQLRQPSTWRGLALVATAAGVNVSPETMHQVITAGAAVAGIIDVMIDETKNK